MFKEHGEMEEIMSVKKEIKNSRSSIDEKLTDIGGDGVYSREGVSRKLNSMEGIRANSSYLLGDVCNKLDDEKNRNVKKNKRLSGRNDERWNFMLDLVKKYVEECLIFPSAQIEYRGEKIGQWYRNQQRLLDNDVLEPSKKEALVELSLFVKNNGIDKLSAYVEKTGLLPKISVEYDKQRLGKWLKGIIGEYNKGTLEPEFIDRLNKITYEWYTQQTYIIGKKWVDNVPFGDLPITIVYSDKECISYMEQGIYGCYQLYMHFKELSNNCFGKNIAKRSEYETKQRDILSALCTTQVAWPYGLLAAIFGESSGDVISKCLIVAEKVGVDFENAEVVTVQKRKNTDFSFHSQFPNYVDEDQTCDFEDFWDAFVFEAESESFDFEKDNADLKSFVHPGKYGAEALSVRIEELNLSDRTYNCLANAEIYTVEALTWRTEEDMIKVRNLGRRSLDEITYTLHSLGLDFKREEE